MSRKALQAGAIAALSLGTVCASAAHYRVTNHHRTTVVTSARAQVVPAIPALPTSAVVVPTIARYTDPLHYGVLSQCDNLRVTFPACGNGTSGQ